VVGVPIANLHGFRRSSRYLPDRRDMNRHFPGRVNGSAAARIAYQLFSEVVLHCSALVDFHTGSFHRRNLPQVRADLTRKDVYDLAVGFGAEIVVHTVGTRGTLRRAASEAGVPAITYEAGQPMEFREDEVSRGVAGLRRLMAHLGMTGGGRTRIRAADIFYSSRWVRANDGGIFLSSVELGERVKVGQPMGYVTDPISNERTEVVSPYGGRVIGVAVNQVVMPGFAAFHVGVDGDRPQAFPVPDQDTPSALDEPVELDERPE
jgi:predicted deacylase